MSSPDPTLLRALLRQRHWQTYRTFCVEYDKAASKIDRQLIRTWPSRGQLHRWTSGELRGLPYPHHCRVLEAMFPGYTAEQLFSPPGADSFPSRRTVVAESLQRNQSDDRSQEGPFSGYLTTSPGFAGVIAVFPSRSEFMSRLPPHALFDNAQQVRASGLSLNLICQQYPVHSWCRLVEKGGQLQFLFLDPAGGAIKRREQEAHCVLCSHTFRLRAVLTRQPSFWNARRSREDCLLRLSRFSLRFGSVRSRYERLFFVTCRGD